MENVIKNNFKTLLKVIILLLLLLVVFSISNEVRATEQLIKDKNYFLGHYLIDSYFYVQKGSKVEIESNLYDAIFKYNGNNMVSTKKSGCTVNIKTGIFDATEAKEERTTVYLRTKNCYKTIGGSDYKYYAVYICPKYTLSTGTSGNQMIQIKSKCNLKIGGITQNISKLEGNFTNYTSNIKFESSNKNVITVDNNGEMTMIAPGKATITMTRTIIRKATGTESKIITNMEVITKEPLEGSYKLLVKTLPKDLSYTKGETLNTKGLTLKLFNSNRGENIKDNITTGFVCSPTKLENEGKQTIKVSYVYNKLTYTTSFDVNVIKAKKENENTANNTNNNTANNTNNNKVDDTTKDTISGISSVISTGINIGARVLEIVFKIIAQIMTNIIKK